VACDSSFHRELWQNGGRWGALVLSCFYMSANVTPAKALTDDYENSLRVSLHSGGTFLKF
jgi:hypothetical protein